ncbi:MAG: SDR family NAD(P)-dependent oxidoreductase [Pseudomonadota bacterium]
MKDVEGKVAFITGAASGMGLAMARSFSKAGMKVVIADIEQSALDTVKAEFDASGAETMTIKVDVMERDAMEAAAEATEAHFGKVHVLVNNAGVGIGGTIDKMSYQDWDWVLGVNLDGVVNGLQAFVNRIQKHGEGGHIVNTASMAGHIIVPGLGVYTATKFAVVGISETMHVELKSQNIGVSVLCPGVVNTNIFNSGRNRPEDMQAETDTADLTRSIGGEIPSDERMAQIRNAALDPAVVGGMVLDAIIQNDLYIFTHPEMQNMVDMRSDQIRESFDRWRQYREKHGV